MRERGQQISLPATAILDIERHMTRLELKSRDFLQFVMMGVLYHQDNALHNTRMSEPNLPRISETSLETIGSHCLMYDIKILDYKGLDNYYLLYDHASQILMTSKPIRDYTQRRSPENIFGCRCHLPNACSFI